MSRFKPKTKDLQVRGESVTVQEMTTAVRAEWLKRHKENPQMSPVYLVSACLLTPALTEKEIAEEPADVVDKIVGAILSLTNEAAGDPVGNKEADEKKH